MAGRRSATVIIQRDGRDKGDSYVLTEMSAVAATEWCIRAMQVMLRAGVDVPPNLFSTGVSGLVTMGIGAILAGIGKGPWHEVKPLLDELMSCVTSLQKAGAAGSITQSALIKSQIEEPATILQIYEEVVSLHLGFSLRERLLYYRKLIPTILTEIGQNTETLTELSPQSPEAGLPV